ncbi:rhodanese-like domain-containing protein [Halopenitus sp. H-Gu1]|uniref:rhodanese-like domain-containing protein n=1 Tax=Halopenitus sp. H-Gu1 TaxID=3242697 RepID=UPI00359E37B9
MVAEIDAAELAALLQDGDSPTIVDIRSRRAFDRGHLPGSRNLPFPELTTRVSELEDAARIVTVCPHGVSSQQAAALISSYAGTADARVESLRGGLEGWNGPLESTAASGTRDEDRGAGETGEGPEAPF